MRQLKIFGFAVFVMASSGCGMKAASAVQATGSLDGQGVAHQALNQDCSEASWNRINAADLFSFCLPSDMEKQSATPIDSYAEQYWNHAIHFSFDYGMYSNSLASYSNRPQYHEENLTIGGYAAKFITFVDPEGVDGDFRFMAAVYWKDVGSGANTHLEMFVSGSSEADQQAAKRIFVSTLFPQ